jgi:hypothetical protein
MNQQERVFHAYAYSTVGGVGVMLLVGIFYLLVRFNPLPLFTVGVTYLVFGIVATVGYIYIIFQAAAHFVRARTMRRAINLKLYQWRERPEANMYRSLGAEFRSTFTYAMSGRFIPFLLVAYMNISLLETLWITLQ